MIIGIQNDIADGINPEIFQDYSMDQPVTMPNLIIEGKDI
jgi:hypothetical protein